MCSVFSVPYVAPFLPLAFFHSCNSFLIIIISLISYLSARLFRPAGFLKRPSLARSSNASFTGPFLQFSAAIRAKLCSPAPKPRLWRKSSIPSQVSGYLIGAKQPSFFSVILSSSFSLFGVMYHFSDFPCPVIRFKSIRSDMPGQTPFDVYWCRSTPL